MSTRGKFWSVHCRALQIACAFAVCQFTAALAESPAQRGIVVIANRTQQSVQIQQANDGERTDRTALAAGEVLPLAVEGAVAVRITSGAYQQQFLLDPNTAYEFSRTTDGGHELRQIGFPAETGSVKSVVRPQDANGRLSDIPIVTVPVRIVVDEEEPLVQSKWEPRLRERVQAASLVLEEHCGVRFRVVEAGVWQSDNRITEFSELLRQLENEAAVPPVRLIIGFTSQRRVGADKSKMGGTRIPLHSHILIREWSKAMSDRERVEVLVHELGHFLGATHSPESTSVMRAQLVDGRSNVRAFRIRFDPVNTLLMNLIAEEMRRRPAVRLADLNADTVQRLHTIYTEIARALPEDPGVALALRLTEPVPMAAHSENPATDLTSSLSHGVRDVLRSLIQDVDNTRPAGTTDEWTNACLRRAALTASGLPEEVSRHAFLLSLGLALDDSGTLRKIPQLQAAWNSAASDSVIRSVLQKSAGRLTMHSRHDLAQHFCVSGALTAIAGEQLALAAGLTKELRDANGGSGFSFADLAADIAGVEFASRVLSSKITLQQLSQNFTVADFLIEPKGLAEGLSSSEFLQKYGTVSGTAFREQESQLRKRILALPGFVEPTE